MAFNIEKRHIPGAPQKAYEKGVGKPEIIVCHECGNDKSTFEGEIDYMTREYRVAFTQYIVGGGGRIVELADPNYKAYGAGPKANPFTLHIELARTKDRATFEKDYAAYVWLIGYYLPKKFDIPFCFNAGRPGIVTHKYVTKTWGGSTHQDPDEYLARFGVTIDQLEKDLKAAYHSEDEPVRKPAEVVKSDSKEFKIKVIVDSLYYYTKADWNAKAPKPVKKNDVFTVVNTLTVKGSKMYKLKSGTYITANTKYVKVI
ncbi:N-acetylmuramoyl-L-alanine amidase [Peribacillus kribbensis]|uniref:N-acetylmuramoyl-L-alanine amidase n=1 Tax=Peribacillus kribbensis TaxID=356658 RepID=UPI00040C5382|nr:N-acetylmuramoyl-L-alanine amidase [Peribacillus kribbensis]